MGIRVTGSFDNTKKFLLKNRSSNHKALLAKYGRLGVEALANATPVESGTTAHSWYYEIVKTNTGYRLEWKNSHMAGQVPVAILIQYGHATGNGGYVQGTDFINPAMKSVFDDLAYNVWKEVSK